MNSQQDSMLTRALDAAANAFFITDHEGRILWLNEACAQLGGYGLQESIGQTPHLWKAGKQGPEFHQNLWETILSGHPWQGELMERRQDGNVYSVKQVITPLLDSTGQVTHFIVCQHDIAVPNRPEATQETQALACHDNLTGLPNRTLFLDLLRRAVADAVERLTLVALMFIDLKDLGQINETYGAATGKTLLAAAAERLRKAIRHTDTVARTGGEFTVLLTDLDSPQVADALAQKLTRIMQEPFMLEQRKIETGISIGISIYPNDAGSTDALLKHADIAMYRARKQDGSSYRFFEYQ